MEAVGLGINPPPSGFDMLNTILGIQQKKIALQQAAQSLQTGQYLQQTAAAGAQQNTQEMNERILMQRAVQDKTDPNTGESLLSNTPDPTTGKIDLDPMKLARFAQNSLPLTGQAVQQNIFKTQSDRAGLAGAVLGLNNEVQDKATSVLRAHIHDPEATGSSIGSELDNAFQGVNTPAAQGASMYTKNMLSLYDKTTDQTKRDDILSHLAQAYDPAAAQRLLKNPAYTAAQTKQGIQQVQTNPLAAQPLGPAGAPVVSAGNQGVAPGVATYPSGSLGAYGPAGPGGGSSGASTGLPQPQGPRPASADAPPQNAPKQVQDAYGQAVSGANAHVEAIRQADNPLDYGNNMQIANQIRKLSKSTDTGPGTYTWHTVLGALGAPVGANNVADYQLLGAYLDRQAAGIRGAMGLPQTNEGGTQSREIAGNVGYQAKALQDKNDLTQALTEGLHQYRNGLDRVAGFGGQASPVAVNKFKNEWTQNFDPNVYKGELAYQRSEADGKAFVKTLSPQEAQSLAVKRAALQALSQGKM